MKDCGFSGEEFELIRILSSWAVSGLGTKGVQTDADNGDGHDAHKVPADMLSPAGMGKMWGLSPAERTELGRQCKRLIDVGRVKYLESCGLKAEVVHYVETDVSPENALILAWK